MENKEKQETKEVSTKKLKITSENFQMLSDKVLVQLIEESKFYFADIQKSSDSVSVEPYARVISAGPDSKVKPGDMVLCYFSNKTPLVLQGVKYCIIENYNILSVLSQEVCDLITSEYQREKATSNLLK